MADEDVVVGISANIAELLAGFNQAAETITASLASIESRVNDASSALEEKMAPAAEHAAESLHHIHEESEGVGGALEDLKGKFESAMEFTGLALAYEALEKLKEKLDELSERAIEFEHLGESLSIGAVAMQGLEAAANESGISTSKLERVMFTLTQRMEQARASGGAAAEKFNDLGISSDMLGDSSFTAVNAMEVLGRETNSNAELIGLLGARMAMIVPMMREMAENHNLAAEGAAKVNALLPSEIAEMTEYHALIAQLTEQFENFASRLLTSVIPAIKEFSADFKELFTVGETGQFVFAEIVYAVQEVVLTVTELAYAFKGAIDVIINGLAVIVKPIAGVAAAMAAMARGEFMDAWHIMADTVTDTGKTWDKIFDDFDKDVAKGEAAVNRMKTGLSGLDEVHPNLKKEEEPEHKSVGQYDDSAYLANQKERIKIHEGMIAEELKEDQDYLTLSIKNANDQAKGVMDAQLGAIKIQEDIVGQRVKTEMFGNVQELGEYKRLIDQKLAAQLAYYNQEEAMARAEGKDTEKYEADKIKATQASAEARVKAEQKATQDIKTAWDGVFKPIQASFADNITKMIEGTESFGQAWRNILAGILDAFIKTIANLVVQWLLGMLENMVVSKTTAMSQIMANAGVAASAAAASVAAIPFVGWAMAPEVAATTFAETAAYATSISAAGGADIPSGVNPKAQLHEKEMVLPANIADPLRQMVSGGGKNGKHVLQVMNGGDHYVITKANLHQHISDLNTRFAFGTKGPF